MPRRRSRATRARREEARRKASGHGLKVGIFAAGALVLLGASAFLVIDPIRAILLPPPKAPASLGEEHRVITTMEGFTPRTLRVAAGRPFTVRLVNPDSQYHTDGGGWHQFRVEALGVDVRIPPRSERSQTFARLAPGTYEFYCDVCCGGKESPSMRGVIEVTG